MVHVHSTVSERFSIKCGIIFSTNPQLDVDMLEHYMGVHLVLAEDTK